MRIPKYKVIPTPIRKEDFTDEILFLNKKIEEALRRIRDTFPVLYRITSFFEPQPIEKDMSSVICTDGKHIFYHPGRLMQNFQFCGVPSPFPDDGHLTDEIFLFDELLHIMIHGLLGHFEQVTLHEHTELFWKTLDLQVLQIMISLGILGNNQTTRLIESLDPYGDSLYYRALHDKELREKIRKATLGYANDDHRTWALPDRPQAKNRRNGQNKGNQMRSPGSIREGNSSLPPLTKSITDFWKQQRLSLMKGNVSLQNNRSGASDPIRNLANILVVSAGNGRGEQAGNLGFRVTPAEEKPMDYRSILDPLKKLCERSREEDTIDPILYSFGLDLYGDVPLVEPLDTVDKPLLKHIVLAIDTSGSCSDYVSRFLTETIEIFRETREYGEFESLHLLTCDWQIQSEDTYTDIEDLAAHSGDFTLRGFGGTDFNPVFERIGKYREGDEEISALIYFSDAEGYFPPEDPGYPVYFILPPWNEFSYSSEQALRKDFNIPDWVTLLTITADS